MNLPAGFATDTVVRLETNLDDLSPEISGAVMEKLFQSGALDVWFTPVQMKKNRPGTMLSVLCDEARCAELVDIVLTETSAFGLRIETIARVKLDRTFESVTTPYGEIRMKLGLKGERIVQAAPEYESCREASNRAGQPIRAIYEAAISAWHQRASTGSSEG